MRVKLLREMRRRYSVELVTDVMTSSFTGESLRRRWYLACDGEIPSRVSMNDTLEEALDQVMIWFRSDYGELRERKRSSWNSVRVWPARSLGK